MKILEANKKIQRGFMFTLPAFVDKSFENKIFEATHYDYHQMRDAVHSSSLKNILISPHAYKFFIENPKPPTKPMKFGTLAHEALLEGSKFLSRYVVTPEFRGLTLDGKETTSMNAKAVKQQHIEWLNSLPPDTQIMTQEDFDRLRYMMDSLLAHKFIQDVLKDGHPEHKMIWRDPATGFKCVCSHDFLSYKNDIWVDVKTTTDPEWTAFRRSGVEKHNYPFQAAKYDRAIKAVHGKSVGDRVWIALQSEPPYETRIHYIDPYYMAAGELMVKRSMTDLYSAITNNHWPQGQNIIEAGEPSKWFKDEFDGPLLEAQTEKAVS